MTHILLAIIYISFVSLGLPDSILGAAWPSMYPQMSVPVSYAGIVSMIIAAGTVVSSLMSDRLTRRLGTGKLTAMSVAATAVALLGFSVSRSFGLLCLFAVPYGLGAGSVDASLNNYVALHFASRHMNWLHCMWGLGAALGPMIMSAALVRSGWNAGYRQIGLMQITLTAVLLISLPIWKDRKHSAAQNVQSKALSLREIFALKGAKPAMVTFFCYCALEATTGLWASSYLVLHHGASAEIAARFASLFYIGITVGRGVSGFISIRLSDRNMVRLGIAVLLIGILMILLPLGRVCALIGLIAAGFGCAPIYPGLLHATPERFGAERSQAIMGVQMACAYVGITLMPPLFGWIADIAGIALYPAFLLLILILMAIMNARAERIFSEK